MTITHTTGTAAVPGFVDPDRTPDSTEEALAEIIAEATGQVVTVAPEGDGWTVHLGITVSGAYAGPVGGVDYTVGPAEGDSVDCWMDAELAGRLSDDDITTIRGWVGRR